MRLVRGLPRAKLFRSCVQSQELSHEGKRFQRQTSFRWFVAEPIDFIPVGNREVRVRWLAAFFDEEKGFATIMDVRQHPTRSVIAASAIFLRHWCGRGADFDLNNTCCYARVIIIRRQMAKNHLSQEMQDIIHGPGIQFYINKARGVI